MVDHVKLISILMDKIEQLEVTIDGQIQDKQLKRNTIENMAHIMSPEWVYQNKITAIMIIRDFTNCTLHEATILAIAADAVETEKPKEE